MSYKIEKYANKEQFIVEYNHRQGLLIQDGAEFVDGLYVEFTYALLPNEMMTEEQAEVEVPNYETVLEEYEEPIFDEDGNITGYETKTREVQVENGTKMVTVTLHYPIINPNYEAEQAQKEAERVGKLSLTKREVFLAIYKDKGITPEQIRAKITDTEALIEFDYAEKYYRGNPLINVLGASLGYTKEQLDYLFEFKSFASVEVSKSNAGVEADGE